MKKTNFVKLFVALFAITTLFSVSADDTVSVKNTWTYDPEVFDLDGPNKEEAISLGQEPTIVAENSNETVEVSAEEIDEWTTPLLKTTWWVMPEWGEMNMREKLISAPIEDIEILYYWGNWCAYCKNLNDFMEVNDILEKYNIEKKEVYQNKENSKEFTQVMSALGVENFAVPFMVYNVEWETTYLIWDTPNIDIFKDRGHTKDHKAWVKTLNTVILIVLVLVILGFVVYSFTNKRKWK